MEYHKIDKGSIEDVLERAKQYRSLLQPDMAISICMDIFAVDKNNQEALVIYILALTDQLSQSESKVHQKKITDSIKRLDSKFLQHYYSGIFFERQARSLLKHSMSRSFAYEAFIEAIAEFEIAEKMAPEHCADPILRYNSCIRTIKKENLQPRQEFDELY
ncbi:MAG: hypothetical protein VYD29_04205 [Pseudomonadota bacterium]|nr:hypothetical protein [Pseudomonadota bacterium]